METIKFSDYKNAVLGCWWGKYAGGVMGMPFECHRGVRDISWYTQENLSGIYNDDVDLQLVFLRACEKYGNKVDSQILAEFWLNYISMSCSEYGAAKANLRAGIAPPMSGSYANDNKDSCGAFIRSEIWACLCAGNPDIAVRYALEDSMVDHGEEGVYGEVFFAAMQAEAFVEKDINKLIEKGLSYIPDDCGITRGVRCAIECYESGKTWKEARKAILQTVPGSFGMMCGYLDGDSVEEDIPVGKHGYDAPSNVALSIMSLLYGQYDLLKTLCIATGCMEDADCTAGSAAATLGIILGYDKLPQEVFAPLEDKITVGSLRDDGDLYKPATIGELTERILRLTPTFLGGAIVDTLSKEEGYTIEAHVKGNDLLRVYAIDQYKAPDFKALLARIPYTARYRNMLYDVFVEFERVPVIAVGESLKVTFKFWNGFYDRQWLECKWHLVEGVEVDGGAFSSICLEQKHGEYNIAEKEYTLHLTSAHSSRIELCLEIVSTGRYYKTYIPVTLNVK